MARRPVDEKIVKLSMDNSDLTQKAQESTSLLSKLRDGLNKIPGVNLGKTTQELSNIGSATKNIPMDSLGESVSSLSNRFSNMGIIGMTVLQNLSNKAVDMGLKLAKSLTIDQIGDGFREYELKMGSIRTIMANTDHEGATLDNVKTALEDLNRYADLTIYNFGQMTDSIGRFTAAGVGLEDSTIAIKGMSNLAATSGATSQQLNSAMYQMSQALAAGRFNLMDWNSLVNSGMGGKITQDGLVETAESMGKVVDMSEGFRESISSGWLTSDVFLETMKRFAEDDSMLEAATKIRTFTQLMETVQESIGSGLGMTFEHIFGDFEEASELFSTLGESMTGWIDDIMDRFNEFVGAIADGGGFLNIFKGLGNVLKPIGQILGSVAEGFGRAFKSITPEVIVNATEKFLSFTESLKLSEGVVKVLTSIFEYFFTGVRLGFTAIKNIVTVVGTPLVGLGKLIASIFEGFTISIPPAAEMINGFSRLTSKAISGMMTWLGNLLSGSSFDGLRRLGEVITSLNTIFDYHYEKTGSVFKALYSMVTEYLKYLNINFDSFSSFVKSTVKTIGDVLGPVWDLVKDIFSGLEFRHFLGGGFLVGAWGIVKKLIENMDGLSGVWKGITDFIETMKNNSNSGGFLTGITESLTEFSDSLKSAISVGNIVAVASAIGILAVSMKILEDLDTAQITRGMAAIAGAMMTLSWGMKALDGVNIGGVGGTKVIAFATAISIMTSSFKKVSDINASGIVKGATALATTTAILVVAMKTMDGVKVGTGPITMVAIAGAIKILVSTLSDIDEVRVEGIVKGLGTIAVLLGEIAVFAKLMDGVKIKMSTALSIAAIGGALHIIVSAIKKIDDIRWQGLVKGLGTVGILLGEIAVFAKLTKSSKVRVTDAVGVTIVASAMHIFANAIKKIDDIRVEGLVKGLTTIAVVLAEVAVFSKLAKGSGMISAGAGLTIMAAAIKIMVPPLKELGEMRWKDLVKGLTAMAGALAAFVVAANLAKGTMSGSLSIAVMATSLTLLIKPIKELSTMTWGELISNLGKLAVTLGVVAGASILLAPAAGPMLAFSAALVGFGAAIALIGGGLALFGTGLVTLAGLTATSVAAIIAAIEMLIDGFIGLLESVGELIVAVIETIATVITDSSETVINAVIALIMALLEGIDNNLEPFIDRGASIVMKLMEGIEKHAEPLVTQGVETIIALINGLTSAIDEHGPELTDAIVKLFGTILVVIVDAGIEMLNILLGWIPGAEGAITSLGEGMTSAIREAFGLDEEVDNNIQRAGGNIDNASPGMRRKSGNLAKGTTDEFRRQYVIDKVGKEKGEELIRNIESGEYGVRKAGIGLGRSGKEGASSVDWSPAGNALANGLAIGIRSRGGFGGSIWNAAWNLGKTALKAVKNAIDSHSPSKETTKEGINFGQGLVNGIVRMTSTVREKAGVMGRDALSATNEFLDSMTTDMDREVRVKVVIDTKDFDDWDPEGFNPVVPNTRFTNRMVGESQPRNNQNEDNLNRNGDRPSETNEYNYDVHIHATGSLPRTTIRKMATQFKEEIETIDRRDRINRGEEVVY